MLGGPAMNGDSKSASVQRPPTGPNAAPPLITCASEWQTALIHALSAGLCVDADARYPVLPKELIALLTSYLSPGFDEMLACESWVIARALKAIPAFFRVSKTDGYGFAYDRKPFEPPAVPPSNPYTSDRQVEISRMRYMADLHRYITRRVKFHLTATNQWNMPVDTDPNFKPTPAQMKAKRTAHETAVAAKIVDPIMAIFHELAAAAGPETGKYNSIQVPNPGTGASPPPRAVAQFAMRTTQTESLSPRSRSRTGFSSGSDVHYWMWNTLAVEIPPATATARPPGSSAARTTTTTTTTAASAAAASTGSGTAAPPIVDLNTVTGVNGSMAQFTALTTLTASTSMDAALSPPLHLVFSYYN